MIFLVLPILKVQFLILTVLAFSSNQNQYQSNSSSWLFINRNICAAVFQLIPKAGFLVKLPPPAPCSASETIPTALQRAPLKASKLRSSQIKGINNTSEVSSNAEGSNQRNYLNTVIMTKKVVLNQNVQNSSSLGNFPMLSCYWLFYFEGLLWHLMIRVLEETQAPSKSEQNAI